MWCLNCFADGIVPFFMHDHQAKKKTQNFSKVAFTTRRHSTFQHKKTYTHTHTRFTRLKQSRFFSSFFLKCACYLYECVSIIFVFFFSFGINWGLQEITTTLTTHTHTNTWHEKWHKNRKWLCYEFIIIPTNGWDLCIYINRGSFCRMIHTPKWAHAHTYIDIHIHETFISTLLSISCDTITHSTDPQNNVFFLNVCVCVCFLSVWLPLGKVCRFISFDELHYKTDRIELKFT